MWAGVTAKVPVRPGALELSMITEEAEQETQRVSESDGLS